MSASARRARRGGCERQRVGHFRFLIAVISAATTLASAADLASFSGRAMGTTWAVNFVPPAASSHRDDLERRVAARLEELERQFSTFRPNSEVSRFNASFASDWQPVSPEVAQVADGSRRISELTAGAFDPTVEPLVRLWGFSGGQRRTKLPGENEIIAARARVGWRNLELRPGAWRKQRPDLAVDLSSMAKGFASDAIVALLERDGIRDAFVQVGGDIRTAGRGPDRHGWRAGIEEPTTDSTKIACVVGLAGEALSTSGDYRNAFIVGGRRYGHIIDPRTGFPANTRLAAVSVVHVSAAESSAWATALFVLGPDEGWTVALRERIACLFFVRNGDGFEHRMTPEFERFVRQTSTAPFRIHALDVTATVRKQR